MNASKTLLTLVMVGLLATPALADWDPDRADEPGMSTNHKMHFPQMPDPFGWDINFTNQESIGGPKKVLADDWVCSETGFVRDIHFWYSTRDDVQEIGKVSVAILDNIKEGPNGFSIPGNVLWGPRDFDPVKTREWGTGQQGWYDPNIADPVLDDHFLIFQANIVDIVDPFEQKQGEVYWLAITVTDLAGGAVTDPRIGWKTANIDIYPPPYAGQHFMDDAVWADVPAAGGDVEWHELLDPIASGESLDLAFVITPEPATMSLIAVGGLGALLRRRRRR